MFGYDNFISSPKSRWGMAMVRDGFKVIFLNSLSLSILGDTKIYFLKYSVIIGEKFSSLIWETI